MDNEVSLREYIEARLRELKRTIDLKYQTTEKATLLATYALEKRLESMNEFREAMKDQAQKFLTKNEFDIRHRRMEEDIKMLEETRVTKSEADVCHTSFEKDIKELTKAKDISEGKASSKSVIIAYIIAIVSLIIGILGIFHV